MNISKTLHPRTKDLTGQQFGYWTILEFEGYLDSNPGKKAWWKCQCRCGRIKAVCGTVLLHGKSTKCQSCANSESSGWKPKDLTGQKFGKLNVIEHTGKTKPDTWSAKYTTKQNITKTRQTAIWKCQCVCGELLEVTSRELLNGVSQCPTCLYLVRVKTAFENSKIRQHKSIIANNLKEQYPTLCQEWDYEKNLLGPDKYAAKSRAKVWWICLQHGSFKSCIENRTGQQTGCPICKTSKGEKRIANTLNQLFIDYQHNRTTNIEILNNIRIDFYLSHHDKYIEYHGQQHYEPIPVGCWGAKSKIETQKRFTKQQKRDQLVRNALGIKLLEIPYTEQDIETRIKEFIGL